MDQDYQDPIAFPGVIMAISVRRFRACVRSSMAEAETANQLGLSQVQKENMRNVWWVLGKYEHYPS